MILDSVIREGFEKSVYPGINAAVFKNGKIVYNFSGGYMQLFPKKERMLPDTIFDLASLTKPLAAAPVALHVFRQEAIKLSTELGYFFNRLSPDTERITLFQLLTHTSGLPPVPEIYKLFKTEDTIDSKKAMEHLFSLKPVIPPGSDILYSCTGYIFLTQVLKSITGKEISELYKKIIADPMGLKNMVFNPPDEIKPRTAATEFCRWRNRWIRGEVHDENSFCLNGEGGNAGLFGNIEDIAAYLSILSNNGSSGGRQILSPETVSLMVSPQVKKNNSRRTVCFTMQSKESFAGESFSSRAYGHTGFTGTSVWIDPQCGLTIIVLTNRVHLGRETTADKIKEFRIKFHSAVFREFC